MNIEQGKKALAEIGLSIAGSSWEEVLTNLHGRGKTK